MKVHLLTAAALASLGAQAQTLPPPPVSPAPVATYEYDANGNATRVIQAPGVSGFGFATATTYDRLNRARNTTDARNGVVQRDYNGREDLTQVTDPRNLVTSYPRDGLGQATGLTSPDTGTASHTYDAAGNLLTRTDSRGVLGTHSYDALSRLTGIVYSASGSPSRSYGWTYDQTGSGFANGIGRLTTATFPEGSTRFTYDAQGRLTSSVQTVNAAAGGNASALTHTASYGYDAAGNVTSITYPSGRVLSITHTDGVPSAIGLAANAGATPVGLISAIQWEPFGAAKSWQWQLDSGTQAHDRIYDSSGRLVRYRLGGVVRDLSYDAAYRISAYTHYDAATAAANPSLDQSFGYDELGRLTGVTTASASWAIGYDANGNRTSVTQSGATRTYTTAASSNRLTALSNPAVAFTHDNAGNTLTGSTAAAAYSSTYLLDNRLGGITAAGSTSTYSYNNAGQRVRKFASSGSGSTVVFVYDPQGHLLGEYDSAGAAIREYAWLGDEPVAVFMPNGANPPSVFYIHNDHINTPRAVVDRSNNLRWRWLAEPFGTTAPETNPQNLGAFAFNLRMPGQYADSETGLLQNWHRDYDASIGRYVQSDPIGLDGGINTYSYAVADPLQVTDPDGLLPVVLVPWVLNGALSFATDVAWQMLIEGRSLRCVDWWNAVGAAAGGTVFSGVATGAVRMAMRPSGYRLGSMTFLRSGTQRGDYVNHSIFRSGPDPNFRIEWATRPNLLGMPHLHPFNPDVHIPIPPLSGLPIGAAMGADSDIDCACRRP
jgi:RHS repeat-associated protein